MKTLHLASSLLASLILFCACSSSTPSRPSGDGGGGSTGTGGSSGATGGSGGASTGGGGSASTGGSGPVGTGGTSVGTGGSPGSGGAAPTVDAGSDATASGGCAGLPFCDDFDTQAAGSPPAAGTWTLVGPRTCSTQGTPWPFAVDSTQWHSPPNSMKVSGGDSCGPLMLNTTAFSKVTGGEVYGRFYVRMSDTAMTFDHAFLMALGLSRDAGAFNTNDQSAYLQLASQGAGNPTNVFMWQTNDGNILPAKNTMGGATSTYPKANTWTCVEFHTSQATGALETWVDSNPVAGLTFIPGTTTRLPSVNDQWTAPSPFVPASIGFGWTVFSGESLTVWFDDIAIASSRIGCM